SKGRSNAEGRFDTSASSLTKSMTWIPASTSICDSQSGKHVGENLTQVRYPVACLRVIDRCYSLLTQGGTSWRLFINDVQAWMFTKEQSSLAQTRWMPMESL